MQLKFSKSSYAAVVLAGLIDAAVTIGFFVAAFTWLPEHLTSEIQGSINPNLLIFFGFLLFRLISIFMFSRTPGMKICKLIFLNAEEEHLNVKEKILASFFVLYRGVDYYHLS